MHKPVPTAGAQCPFGVAWAPVGAELTVFWNAASLEHDTGAGLWEAPPSDLLDVQELHPENAERIQNMRSVLVRGPLAGKLDWRDGRLAEVHELETVHPCEYIRGIREACDAGGRRFEYSTVLSARSWRPLLAAIESGAAPFMVSNESGTITAVDVATQVAPAGSPFRIEDDPPPCA